MVKDGKNAKELLNLDPGPDRGRRKSLAEKMTPSKENYLKVMLELSKDEDIRSIDIANTLGVTKASVSHMVGVLKDEGYVTKEKYGTVALTEKGREVAAFLKRRYELIKSFLHNVLGVEVTIAAEDACRIEHIINFETVKQIERKLKEHYEGKKDALYRYAEAPNG